MLSGLSTEEELADRILTLKKNYYAGIPVASDEDYDKLENSLRLINPNHPVLSIVGSSVSGEKIKHETKMLSLDKTYDEEKLANWIGETEVISLFKIDGSSCSLVYNNGILEIAKTRGDGNYGENITSKCLMIGLIPTRVSESQRFEVRGEIFITQQGLTSLTDEMISLGLETPSSMRNIVAGLLGRKEHIQLASHLSFKAFEYISAESEIEKESEKLQKLKSLGFDIPDFFIHKGISCIKDCLDECKKFMSEGDYLIDGLVFAYNDLKLHRELGENSHHPKYKLAFKFEGETKEAVLVDIEWSVSRNGILTPVAIIEPTELSGAMISRVTLHNYGVVKNYSLNIGDTIEIIRSGEVIPKFLGVKQRALSLSSVVPTLCPSCNTKLNKDGIWLTCENESCSGRKFEEILNYVKKSGMDDISDKRLKELMNAGLVVSVGDLYKVDVESLLKIDKVKDKMALKIYQEIQKTKNIDFVKFVSAIGIEGVSDSRCEKIANAGFESIEKLLIMSVNDFMTVDSLSNKSSKSIFDSLQSKKEFIHDLLNNGVTVKPYPRVVIGTKLQGEQICITGDLSIPRKEMERIIKSNGGKVSSSVSSKTTALLTNEKESSSTKAQTAKRLGIKIINEDELDKLLNI